VNKPINAGLTHTRALLFHTISPSNTPSEQGFYQLSTDNKPGYYYYLYIQETPPQANHPTFRLISSAISVDAFPRDVFNKTEKMRMRAAA
jgi:hypothetical protein